MGLTTVCLCRYSRTENQRRHAVLFHTVTDTDRRHPYGGIINRTRDDELLVRACPVTWRVNRVGWSYHPNPFNFQLYLARGVD